MSLDLKVSYVGGVITSILSLVYFVAGNTSSAAMFGIAALVLFMITATVHWIEKERQEEEDRWPRR